ncbi:MAG: amidohydrolase [Deltaproteobacteria bacterium]|nr:MAG: amidohydrolase [Deltaproteobacteria bacterium]
MQHPSRAFLAHPVFESLRRWSHGGLAEADVPLEATIGAMDDAGVRVGLLCAWWGPQGPLIGNDEVAACVRRYPDRLVGVASVDLHRPLDAVRELRRCVRELGFRALRIVPWLWNLPPDDRRYYPLYAECVELGIPFCLQVGHTGPLCPSEPGRPIPYLDHVALEFPELKIVGGHIGYPWCAEMISLATKYENVYIDTSAYKVRRYPREIVDYLRGHGRRKVLFGSNHPAWPASACLEELDTLGLDTETERLFLYENAERVFGLKPAAV